MKICRQETVPFMYLMIRNNFRSQSEVHRVIWVVSTPTARKRSGRANRAMYMIFIKTLQAIFARVPPPAPLPLDNPSCDGIAPFLPPAPTCVGGGSASSIMIKGSLDSSRKGVGAVPTLAIAVPERSQKAATQSLANGFHIVGNHLH